MRRASKTLAAALVALLLAVGIVACGGGDDSDSTAATATTAPDGQQQSAGKPAGDASRDEGKTGEGKPNDSGGDASEFVPKPHDDSGGGSEQFKVKGGDNSVQEFGAEADAGEFDAAAAVLHNFLDARAEGNWAAACQYMFGTVVESFEKLAAQAKGGDTSCGAVLEKLTNPAAATLLEEEAAQADVRSLRSEGERAFLIYTIADGTVMAMPMGNEGGDWKVAGLTGTPLS